MPYKNKSDKAAWRRANSEMVAKHKKTWFDSPNGKAYLEKKRAERAKDSAIRKAKKSAHRMATTRLPSKEKLAYCREWSRKLRLAAIAALGGHCVQCGISDERVLEFDHIKPILRRTNGHTQKDNRIDFRRIIEGAEHGLQLLCANCHRIKTREANEWALRFDLGAVVQTEQQLTLI